MDRLIYPLLLHVFSCTLCTAQLSVQTSHLSTHYAFGDTVQLKITGNTGTAHYRIWEDKFTPTTLEGTIQLINNQAFINWKPNRSGIWQCEVTQNTSTAKTAIAVAPYTLTALAEEPADFDAFWEAAKAELDSIPLDEKLTFYNEDEYSTTYRVNLANINNRRVYGYISIPKTEGPFPAMLVLPPYGTGANLVTPKSFICRDLGAIALSISIHNIEPDQRDPDAYQPNIIADPTQNYYRQAITGAIQAINYLSARSDFNGNLAVSGVSQGAGLAVMTAGVDDRVKLLIYSGVTHAQHQGFDYQQVSGFPYYLYQTRFASAERQADIRSAVSYYEAIYFARRFTGEAVATIGYLDQVTHPATQFAVFNNLPGKKTLIHDTKIDHAHPNAFWQMRYAAFFQCFPEAGNLAWQYANVKTAYAIQIEADSVAVVGEPFHVDAAVFLNGEAVDDLRVEWAYGKANDTTEILTNNTLNTQLLFPDSGDYVIRLRVEDQRDLEAENLFFTVEETINIQVKSPPIPNELTVTCPVDSIILLPSDVDSILLNWSLPTVQSVCDSGGVTVLQTNGILQNTYVGIGTYEVDYLLFNQCQDTFRCYLQFIVEQEEETTSEADSYCENRGVIPWQEWIEEVQLNDLSLFSHKEGYGDFLEHNTSLYIDSSYQMNVRIGYKSMDTTEHIHAYIDFNHDSIFQTSERILQYELIQGSSRSGSHIIQATVLVPIEAKIGTTRMRVLLSKATPPTPCDLIQYGEVEDYSIVVAKKGSEQITVATTDLGQQLWQVYPNPSDHVFYLKGESSEANSAQLMLYDALGRHVQTTAMSMVDGENTFTFSSESLQNGLYYLQIVTRDKLLWQQTILVQH